MIEGTLIVNFEPPYIGFSMPREIGQKPLVNDLWRYCSKEEIRDLLIELDVISANQAWPPRDLILRLPVNLPRKVLENLNLTCIIELEQAS